MFWWLDVYTIFSSLWRSLVVVLDWRTWLLRAPWGRPKVDAVFISNMRDETDKKRFLGNWKPKCGHFNGPRYWFRGISGRTRVLYITTEELKTDEGRIKARELFIDACRWARKKGARVVLLAAGTKRLFGENGETLKQLFPEMVLTIGDNGTILLLQMETKRALEEAGLSPQNTRVAVLGPYGLLGEQMTRFLIGEGYNVIGAGPNDSALKRVAEQYGIKVYRQFKDIGKVDAVVACTHSEKIRLSAESIERLRKTGRKLLVVDVAEPSNLKRRTYLQCKDRVIRQDAGNGYSSHLKYVLGAITYKMFRLTRGVTFGCFAETLVLARESKRNPGLVSEDSIKEKYGMAPDISGCNWFSLDDDNMEKIKDLFEKHGFGVPSPRCFGLPVKSFELEADPSETDKPGIRFKGESVDMADRNK